MLGWFLATPLQLLTRYKAHRAAYRLSAHGALLATCLEGLVFAALFAPLGASSLLSS